MIYFDVLIRFQTVAARAQSLLGNELLHPRGFCISAEFSCPVCSKMVRAMRLYLSDGVATCHQCNTDFKVGINLYVLPVGIGQAWRIAPDEQLSGPERTARSIRGRTRKRRQADLRSMGLDDAVPQIALQRYQDGSPIHTVMVVEPPKS